jgi:hypothetical protein
MTQGQALSLQKSCSPSTGEGRQLPSNHFVTFWMASDRELFDFMFLYRHEASSGYLVF